MSESNSKPANPYVGPRSFREKEKLYGRDRETSHLVNLIIAERIVLLYSPSGAGKTSLIYAALLPRLRQRRFNVNPVIRTNREPVERIDRSPAGFPNFNRYIFSVLLSLDEALPEADQCSETELAGMSLADYLNRHPSEGPQLFIFDQFEEILILDPTDQEAKQEFFLQLGEMLEDRSRWALFAMREDFVAALDPFLIYLPTRLSTTFRLELLNETAAMEAIQKPSLDQQVDFTMPAASKLVSDLRRVKVPCPDGSVEERPGPHIEPVQLQVVCSSLWEKLSLDDQEISESDITTVGSVDDALSDFYASRLKDIAADTGTPERQIRAWIDRKLITDQGIRGQVMENVSGESEGLDNAVLRQLVNVHLLRSDTRRGITWYELAHDRLVKPIRQNNQAWFEANLSLLQRQAEVWERADHPDGVLLHGQALLDAESWAKEHEKDLTRTERAFLRASQNARKAEEDERRREQEERQRAEDAMKYEAAQQLAAIERQRAEAESHRAEAERLRAEERAAAAKKLRARLIWAVIAAFLALAFGVNSALSLGRVRQQSQANATLAVQRDVAARTAVAAGNEARYQAELAALREATASAAQVTAQVAEATSEAASVQAIDERNQLATAEAVARQESRISLSRQLAASSLMTLPSQPGLASLLGVEAFHAANTYEARNALLSRLQYGLGQLVQDYGRPIPSGKDDVLAIALSPDGQRMAWGTAVGDIVLWNYREQIPIRRWKAHTRQINGVTFSPDGSLLVSAAENGEITLWDSGTGRQRQSLTPVINAATSVAFDRNGSRLAAGVGSRVVIWDMDTLEVSNLDGHSDFVTAVAWSSDGTLASSGDDRRVILWDLENASPLFVFRQQVSPVKSIAWFPDDQTLASASRDGTIALINTRTGQLAAPLLRDEKQLGFLSVAVSPDGSLLASGSEEGAIILWDLESMSPVHTLDFHIRDVTGLSFNVLGNQILLASASIDNSVGLYEIVTQQPIGEVVAGDLGSIYTLAVPEGKNSWIAGRLDQGDSTYANNPRGSSLTLVSSQGPGASLTLPGDASLVLASSPDGRWTAAGSATGEIRLFAPDSQEPALTWQMNFGTLFDLAFSQDGTLLASAHCRQALLEGDRTVCVQNEVYLWDTATGTRSGGPFVGHSDYITALAVDKARGILATGSRDQTILLWDMRTREPVGLPMSIGTARISALSFSPDGVTLASGFDNGSLVLWDVASSHPLGSDLKAIPGAITALAFTSSGIHLLSAHIDGSLIAWDVDVESWHERVCELAGRNLTPDEWRQYFPGAVYRDTCSQWAVNSIY